MKYSNFDHWAQWYEYFTGCRQNTKAVRALKLRDNLRAGIHIHLIRFHTISWPYSPCHIQSSITFMRPAQFHKLSMQLHASYRYLMPLSYVFLFCPIHEDGSSYLDESPSGY